MDATEWIEQNSNLGDTGSGYGYGCIRDYVSGHGFGGGSGFGAGSGTGSGNNGDKGYGDGSKEFSSDDLRYGDSRGFNYGCGYGYGADNCM